MAKFLFELALVTCGIIIGMLLTLSDPAVMEWFVK